MAILGDLATATAIFLLSFTASTTALYTSAAPASRCTTISPPRPLFQQGKLRASCDCCRLAAPHRTMRLRGGGFSLDQIKYEPKRALQVPVLAFYN